MVGIGKVQVTNDPEFDEAHERFDENTFPKT